jgi:hypothetical protein
MTKQQQQFLNSLFNNQSGNAQQTFGKFLEGGSADDQFQKGVIDPTMRTYENQVLPAIEQRFGDVNAGSSSALNQALVSSSQDLANVLGGQRIGYQNMQNTQQLGALGQLLSLLTQKQFEPIVQGPQRGLLGDLIGAAGQTAGALGGAAIMKSSRKVKSNIRDYGKGLETVRDMEVKQYDYTIEVPGKRKDRVGLIAEEMPNEIQADVEGIKGVDLYGLVSILVNCVKQLDAKVQALEAK